ncbi:hypothetical protein QBC37DRAFT_487592 [Rhypophila decipiens]|uniref:Uncharacterized protein n=1 Tax=Rhypophila decipiens TaxID=261697 RepID=A0AAN6XVE1_9PEZI|nr:hypothetical protein QBC37DRAFT_487592 [Rhypophila decipiens]
MIPSTTQTLGPGLELILTPPGPGSPRLGHPRPSRRGEERHASEHNCRSKTSTFLTASQPECPSLPAWYESPIGYFLVGGVYMYVDDLLIGYRKWPFMATLSTSALLSSPAGKGKKRLPRSCQIVDITTAQKGRDGQLGLPCKEGSRPLVRRERGPWPWTYVLSAKLISDIKCLIMRVSPNLDKVKQAAAVVRSRKREGSEYRNTAF